MNNCLIALILGLGPGFDSAVRNEGDDRGSVGIFSSVLVLLFS